MTETTPPSGAPESRRPRRRRRERPELEVASADPRAWQAVGIVAGAAALLAVIGLLVPGPQPEDVPSAATEPVNSSTVVCPEPGSVDGARTTSTVTVVPGFPGQDREGEATIGYLEGTEEGVATDTASFDQPQGSLDAPGDGARVVAETQRLPALETRTFGGLAPGLVAAQTTQDSFNDGRGLSSLACLGPDTTWWFVGGGSTAGRESVLELVNPEDTPADVEVSISGPDGPVQTPRLRGLVVEPRSRLLVRLSREAPRLPAATWRVTVRSGRVVAAVSDTETDGFVPRGADWVPPSADPSTRVLIPGVIGGEGGRQLLIHAPGDLSATVRVRLITASGSFVPSAAPEVEVPGGSVVSVDLDSALQGEDATVDLSSDVPIVAGVRQRHPGIDATAGSLEEFSYAAGAPVITGSAAVSGLPAERATSVTVWLTAPGEVPVIRPSSDMADEGGSSESSMAGMASDGAQMADDTAAGAPSDGGEQVAPPVAVTVRVLAVDDNGDPLPPDPDQTITVPRDRVVAVDIPRPAGAAWFTVLATVTDGDVVIAHRVLRRNRDGALITGYPWRPLRTAVTVPRAEPAPELAVR